MSPCLGKGEAHTKGTMTTQCRAVHPPSCRSHKVSEVEQGTQKYRCTGRGALTVRQMSKRLGLLEMRPQLCLELLGVLLGSWEMPSPEGIYLENSTPSSGRSKSYKCLLSKSKELLRRHAFNLLIYLIYSATSQDLPWGNLSQTPKPMISDDKRWNTEVVWWWVFQLASATKRSQT
jgi:hypothetical protein